jgi:hypothetical protein
MVEESSNRVSEFAGAAVNVAAQLPFSKQRAPAFDQVKPGTTGRGVFSSTHNNQRFVRRIEIQADPATAARSARTSDSRFYAPRHHRLVCRARYPAGNGNRLLSGAAPPSRGHPLLRISHQNRASSRRISGVMPRNSTISARSRKSALAAPRSRVALKTSGRVASKTASPWSLYKCRPPKLPPVAWRRRHWPYLPASGSNYQKHDPRVWSRRSDEIADLARDSSERRSASVNERTDHAAGGRLARALLPFGEQNGAGQAPGAAPAIMDLSLRPVREASGRMGRCRCGPGSAITPEGCRCGPLMTGANTLRSIARLEY